MAKKSTTKKKRITTAQLMAQLEMLQVREERLRERVLKLEQVPHTASSFEADMRAAFAKRGMDYDEHQAKKAARALEANSHPQRVEVEPWKPKVGDILFFTGAYEPPQGRLCKMDERGWLSPRDVGITWMNSTRSGEKASNLRPATPEEITLYKQEVEWAKVKGELQEGDSCWAMPEELSEIACVLPLQNPQESLCSWIQWRAFFNSDVRLYRTSGDFDDKGLNKTAIPFSEFLRRAKGTAARLKKEAQEKERIQFGTPVKVKDMQSEGVYWYGIGDKHKVVFGAGSHITVPRNEITIIEP